MYSCLKYITNMSRLKIPKTSTKTSFLVNRKSQLRRIAGGKARRSFLFVEDAAEANGMLESLGLISKHELCQYVPVWVSTS